jgi:hypothetical protein
MKKIINYHNYEINKNYTIVQKSTSLKNGPKTIQQILLTPYTFKQILQFGS